MAVTQTIPPLLPLRKSDTESAPESERITGPEPIIPRRGVVTLFGYGIKIRVNGGHADDSYRDSLACDLMEPVRPQVDAFVFDWITGKALKRE